MATENLTQTIKDSLSNLGMVGGYGILTDKLEATGKNTIKATEIVVNGQNLAENPLPDNSVLGSSLVGTIDLGELPAPLWIISAGGRKLYRHSSNMGTVIEFNDGVDRKVLVLDAQYRSNFVIVSSSYTDTSLPNYSRSNTNGNWYIHGTNSSTTPSACASLTDATLNSLWVNSIDTNTSKYNTDVWLTQSKCECANHCRSITVNSVSCDIPNIQTLMRIYCEAINLDELDPTVSSYPNLKMSALFGSGAMCSSSEYNANYVRQVYSNGKCNGNLKDVSFGVCPVLELS